MALSYHHHHHYQFIAFLYILYDIRDKAIYWSKIAIFSYPAFHTPLGGLRPNILIPFGVEKLE